MRFQCEQQSLQRALDYVTRVIDANATLPVLNNILVKASGKNVYFSATNLELAIKYHIVAEVLNEGAITVPARLLFSYIQLLGDKDVDVVVEDGLTLSIKSATSKTKIKCIAVEEFPTISSIDVHASVSLETEGLAKAINQVVFAAATNTTRPVLAGVYLDVVGKQVKMVATDSYRLSEKKFLLLEDAGKAHCIIPSRAMMEIARLVEKEEEVKTLKISVGENQVMFELGRIEFYSRLVDGNFPAYEQIIPREFASQCTLLSEDFSMAVKRVNLFAKENNHKVVLDLSANTLSITTPATQIGEEEAQVVTSLTGVPNKVALNSDYLLQFLANFSGRELEMKMNDEKGPPLFQGLSDDSYVHIIMPLRMG